MSRALVVALAAAEFVVGNRHVVPRSPGLYAWWVKRGAMGNVPFVSHPHDRDYGLLYIGVSPTIQRPRRVVPSTAGRVQAQPVT